MDCRDFKKWLIDKDILGAGAAESAARHMESCERCAELFETDLRLEKLIKKKLAQVEAPDALRAAVEMDIQSADRESLLSRVSWKRAAPAVLASAAVILLLLNPFGGRIGGVNRLADLAVENHLSGDLTMDVKAGSSADIAGWFEERLGFRAVPPDMKGEGLVFLGGRLCRLGPAHVAYFFYDKGGRTVSLFVAGPEKIGFDLPEGKIVRMPVRGCQVSLWRTGNLICVMVA